MGRTKPLPPIPRKPLPPIPKKPGKKPLPPLPSLPSSLVVGGLIEEMQRQTHEVGNRLAVLIVDEAGGDVHPETPAQLQVLQAAQNLSLPIFAVEINQEVQYDPLARRITTKPAFLRYAHRVLNKPHINIFDDNTQPNFSYLLQVYQVDVLVLMGYHANQCVKHAAIGGHVGPPQNPGAFINGAVQRGFYVMTSDRILRGGAANWKNSNGVWFYTHV